MESEPVRFLFIHQNFPGQFLHIIRYLAAFPENEIVFISETNENVVPNIRRVLYRMERAPEVRLMPGLHELEVGLLRAQAVASAAHKVKALGFTPDIVIGHHGWGELLDIKDVYPHTPILGYFEFFYHTTGLDVEYDPEFPIPASSLTTVRQKNAINLLALNLNENGQTPTDFQLRTYPEWARPRINLIREGVDLKLCRPDPTVAQRKIEIAGHKITPGKKLVTFVSRNLEPYRGFHTFMRALPRILNTRRDVEIALVGGDRVSYGKPPEQKYGCWREALLDELKGQIDLERVHFLGQVGYTSYIELMQRSDTHVYLTYPFVASWSMREAMAMGCAIVGSDTDPVKEFVTHNETGLLTSGLDPEQLAASILTLLEDRALSARLRKGARQFAEAHLDLDAHLAHYGRVIRNIVETSGVTPSAT